MDLLIKSLVAILLSVAAMTAIVQQGVFKDVHVELGYHHYAEKIQENLKIKMPWNAAVNIAYVLDGIYWIWKIRQMNFSRVETFFFDVFSLMAIVYAPIQFARIATQKHIWAVMDQWVTLPFFTWTILWGCHFHNDFVLTRLKACGIVLASLISYGMTLSTPIGFDYTLGVHILIVFVTGLSLHIQHGNRRTAWLIVTVAVCCFGFASLKLADLHLAKLHPVFTYISGHFISKICDVLQIHFAAEYYLETVKIVNRYKHD